MTDRPLIFLDTETTGLNPSKHEVWEIAYAVDDGPILRAFVSHQPPVVSPDVRQALRVNGYLDRVQLVPKHVSAAFEDVLIDELDGATLVGANPAFDAAMLFARWGRAPWHYRLLAMGVLGWDSPRSLSSIASALEIDQPAHAAETDVRVLRECWHALRATSAQMQQSAGVGA